MRGMATDASAGLAYRLSGMDDNAVRAFLKNEHGGFLAEAVRRLCRNADIDEYRHAELFERAMRRLDMKRIRSYAGRMSFRLFLAGEVSDVFSRIIPPPKPVAASAAPVSGDPGVNPELQYLSIERRPLFTAAADVVAAEVTALKPAERLLLALRLHDHLPFKDISLMTRLDSSSREFEKVLKRLSAAVLPRIERALEEYFGGER